MTTAIVFDGGAQALGEAAYKLGLCPVCFHTRQCCGGICWTLDGDYDPYDHVCRDIKAQSLSQSQVAGTERGTFRRRRVALKAWLGAGLTRVSRARKSKGAK
jgi:hypothetical protein